MQRLEAGGAWLLEDCHCEEAGNEDSKMRCGESGGERVSEARAGSDLASP